MEVLLTILKYALEGGVLATLIVYFVQRHDQKKGLEEKFKKMEKDSVRTQLLLIMYNYTEADEQELLTVAEHYFKVLKGDWYLTSKFQRFLDDWNIPKPQWFE